MYVITDEMKAQATRYLNNLNDMRRAAVQAYENTIGKVGETDAFDLAMDFSKQYEIAFQGYAKAGFRNLGIHNVK